MPRHVSLSFASKVTNCISTTKIQKISEITNFFRHYFLSRTEVRIWKK